MGKASPEAIRRASKKWKERNPEHVRAYQNAENPRRYAANRADGICVYCQKSPARTGFCCCQSCQDRIGWAARKRKYGIDQTAYIGLLEEQDGRCAICAVDITTDAHIDHDHDTKQVRGLLCGHCNRGLGCFRDSPEALDMAAKYLRSQER